MLLITGNDSRALGGRIRESSVFWGIYKFISVRIGNNEFIWINKNQLKTSVECLSQVEKYSFMLTKHIKRRKSG